MFLHMQYQGRLRFDDRDSVVLNLGILVDCHTCKITQSGVLSNTAPSHMLYCAMSNLNVYVQHTRSLYTLQNLNATSQEDVQQLDKYMHIGELVLVGAAAFFCKPFCYSRLLKSSGGVGL